MGYYADQMDASFAINRKSFTKALKAIKALGKERGDMPYGCFCSWVDMGFVDAENLMDAMEAWRWEVEIDEKGNISGVEFMGEKLGDDKVLFDAIAPFVKDGSYIEMQGGDGEMWRWVFKDGKCEEIYPKIHWDD